MASSYVNVTGRNGVPVGRRTSFACHPPSAVIIGFLCDWRLFSLSLGERAGLPAVASAEEGVRGKATNLKPPLILVCMGNCSHFTGTIPLVGASGGAITGTSVMPHSGHLPGPSSCTAACSGIGQV